MNPVICVAGPTASGKTALAVEVATELNGEVVSCDSMQVYRRMDIGTAKPTVEEMQGIPHHMIDVAEPEEDFSVSRYCEMAAPIVDDIAARGYTRFQANGPVLEVDVTDLSELDFPRLMGSLTGFVQRAVPGYPLRLPTRNARSHRK